MRHERGAASSVGGKDIIDVEIEGLDESSSAQLIESFREMAPSVTGNRLALAVENGDDVLGKSSIVSHRPG